MGATEKSVMAYSQETGATTGLRKFLQDTVRRAGGEAEELSDCLNTCILVRKCGMHQQLVPVLKEKKCEKHWLEKEIELDRKICEGDITDRKHSDNHTTYVDFFQRLMIREDVDSVQLCLIFQKTYDYTKVWLRNKLEEKLAQLTQVEMGNLDSNAYREVQLAYQCLLSSEQPLPTIDSQKLKEHLGATNLSSDYLMNVIAIVEDLLRSVPPLIATCQPESFDENRHTIQCGVKRPHKLAYKRPILLANCMGEVCLKGLVTEDMASPHDGEPTDESGLSATQPARIIPGLCSTCANRKAEIRKEEKRLQRLREQRLEVYQHNAPNPLTEQLRMYTGFFENETSATCDGCVVFQKTYNYIRKQLHKHLCGKLNSLFCAEASTKDLEVNVAFVRLLLASGYLTKTLGNFSKDLLPPGWEMRKESNGCTFYVDHINRKAQRTHPITGWGMAIATDGRQYYIDDNTKTTLWECLSKADLKPVAVPIGVSDVCNVLKGESGTKLSEDELREFVRDALELAWKMLTAAPPLIASCSSYYDESLHQYILINDHKPKKGQLVYYLAPILYDGYGRRMEKGWVKPMMSTLV